MKTKFLSTFVIFALLFGKFTNAFDASNNDSLYQDITDYGDVTDSSTEPPPNLGNIAPVKVLDTSVKCDDGKACAPCTCDHCINTSTTPAPCTNVSTKCAPCVYNSTSPNENPIAYGNEEFKTRLQSLCDIQMAVLWTILALYWLLSTIAIASMFIVCYPRDVNEIKQLSKSTSIVKGESKSKSAK